MSRSHSIAELKKCVRNEIAATPKSKLRRVTAGLQKRWKAFAGVELLRDISILSRNGKIMEVF